MWQDGLVRRSKAGPPTLSPPAEPLPRWEGALRAGVLFPISSTARLVNEPSPPSYRGSHPEAPTTASIQVESLRQHIKCASHYLLRVFAKLPVEARMIVGIDATLECSGVSGPIKEPRRDTQGTDTALPRPDQNVEGQ